jgi:hypothetical protein
LPYIDKGMVAPAHAAVASPMLTAMADELTISDTDRDSLYILPLAIIPLRTPALRRARMIKNVRLDSAVELFEDAKTGSGQIEVEDLPHEFGWCERPPQPDLLVLRKLALLPSFDVYSLRVLLRRHDIPVNDYASLRLSKAKKRGAHLVHARVHPAADRQHLRRHRRFDPELRGHRGVVSRARR